MKVKVINLHKNTRLFWLMAVVSICSIGLYIYSVNATVRAVAERQQIETELSERIARIGELEFEYIGLKNSVDLALASEMGFAMAQPTAYVSRNESVALASGGSFSR
ncbi:MAG: hypothetical protein A2741_01685 [Candidatus Zambryskibacteria bacterium RIFCSPHIGHO2_01_FULL_43_27]|uniref:Cell division protein FtsL n=1 Tax=Candidatus Zambryskibacteria bacterium RIFCSPLOWO2_01_FULL_43_17 TaxID=1802760 RepID=A0A1G2U0I7_9BACT|nr:MAG: hypothetical protein A2741_01685 [Candidatus Zambryskibacteria bacterium RIFCSPHIGHO2_01_FULL_43_27]OHB00694.1 MAG: hypothetical protein A3E93_03025 [Candidatus Zambryskibacteria bacterium RIFCSPHIGHO2_12_FULL_43_12b]OHB02993.1 MAG: hypothetical protein A2920_02890 [Candidatus Zambryskibacteria bacterium RIFCSPLOWO2_01_FULL_43_17]